MSRKGEKMNFLRKKLRRLRDLIRFLKLFKVRKDLHLVTNKNILAKISEDDVYKKYEKEYSELIARGVDMSLESAPCNKIWICWLQGEENAPELVRACINSIRCNFSTHEVIILSEKNISTYIQFPEYIEKKWKEKKFGAAHFSDLLRTALLCQYGGIWIDATVLCTSNDIPTAITESPLFVYQIIDLIRWDREPIVASSWFISSYSNHPILLLTRALLYKYWETNEYTENYFLFHIFFAIATRRYKDEWKKVPVYTNQSPHTLQFELGEPYNESRWNEITRMSVFHKLNHHNDYTNTGQSFYYYIIKTFL